MMAVVFWHARKKSVERKEYQQTLVDFHQGLATSKAAQFRFSAIYETPAMPWLETETEVFEDWYVNLKFAGIDALDEVVLNAPACREPHERLMDLVDQACGGMFGFEIGNLRLSQLPCAAWFKKPQSCPVEDLICRVNPNGTKADVSLWTRSLGAGPVANCLLSAKRLELPESFSPLYKKRKLVWSGR